MASFTMKCGCEITYTVGRRYDPLYGIKLGDRLKSASIISPCPDHGGGADDPSQKRRSQDAGGDG